MVEETPDNYAYVGPEEIRTRSSGMPHGTAIETIDDLRSWLAIADRESKHLRSMMLFP